MSNKISCRFLCFVLLMLGAQSSNSHAATLIFDPGTFSLIGASGVNIDGALYDVEFIDGTCIEVFNGCDQTSDFTFTSASGTRPSVELLLQVFDGLDDPFDDPAINARDIVDGEPEVTRGCSAIDQACEIHTPVQIDGIGRPTTFSAINNPSLAIDDIGGGMFLPDDDFATIATSTWARWTPVNPVPVPPAVWLFGTALVGIVGLGKRRRSA